MGFLRNTKGSIISDAFMLTERHEHLSKGLMYDVALYADHLEIRLPLHKEKTTLLYSQITDIEYGSRTEIAEKSKSVIGRALVGGILLGGVGAVIGAVSGTGKKEKKETHLYFIISYTATDGDEKYIMFEDTRMYKGRKLYIKLTELCGINTGGNVAL
jgi:hypothetical protein